MKVPKSVFKPILCAAICLLAACGEAKTDVPKGVSTLFYKPSITEPVEFVLPNEDLAQRFFRKEKGRGVDTAIISEEYELSTGKWQIWYTGNIWSNNGPASANGRISVMADHLMIIDKFRKANDLDIEVNFIQTDGVSVRLGLADAKRSKGWSLSPAGGVCDGFFYMCTDNYVISPFGRDGMTEAQSQYAWLKPYDQKPEWIGDHMDGHRGYNDKTSDYWNQTPPAAFLVNPDGMVVDAIVPLLHGINLSPGKVIRAMIYHMDLEMDDLVYPPAVGNYADPALNSEVSFGKDYTETFIEDFSKALQ